MEWKLNMDEQKEELSNQIELSCGFEVLRTILNDFEEDKMWMGNQELIRREALGANYPRFKKSR